uniref:Uncharacterized protein n=1 Tax=Ceratitis capitata TaxID=7213 RepID=W8BEI2_CERCA
MCKKYTACKGFRNCGWNGLFKVIRKLYEIDQDNFNFKIYRKRTRAYIDPGPFDKLSVSRATQIFGNSVAAGIGMAIKQELFGKDLHTRKCAKATQLVVKRMIDLFG